MVDPFVLSRAGCKHEADLRCNVRPEDLLMARLTTPQRNAENYTAVAEPVDRNATVERRTSGISSVGATTGVVCSPQTDEHCSVPAMPDVDLEAHSRMTRKLARVRAEMAQWEAGTRRMRPGDPPPGLGPV